MKAKTIVREIIGGFVMAAVLFATLILLLWCSSHTTYAAETWTEVGECRITHYCNCSRCCGKWAGGKTASGTMPERFRTIAVDPDVIPIGSRVYIDGYGFRIAEDTGVHGSTIDVFCPDHSLCLKLGVKRKMVWIVKGENE